MNKQGILDRTITPLDTFREILGIDPYRFWQFDHPDHGEVSECDVLYTHFRYQSSNRIAGRYEFSNALFRAEFSLCDKLGYYIGPMYSENETAVIGKVVQPVVYATVPNTFQTKWRHVLRVGKLTWTNISSEAIIIDMSSDEVVLTVTGVTGYAENEITVCYANEYVRIRPIEVSISGDTATITIRRWLLANPLLWNSSVAIDATVAANYVASVDIYRRYIDVTDQLTLVWRPTLSTCNCELPTCTMCNPQEDTGCAFQGNFLEGTVAYKHAIYSEGQWIYSTACLYRRPDMVCINYEHGLEIDDPLIDYWSQMVVHYAIALIPDMVCGCCDVLNESKYWQEDLSHAASGLGSYMMGQSEAENPFGHRRGAIEAWHAVLQGVGA